MHRTRMEYIPTSDATIPLHVWIVKVHRSINRCTVYNLIPATLPHLNKISMRMAPIITRSSSQVNMMEPGIRVAIEWYVLSDPILTQYSIGVVPLYDMKTYKWHPTTPYILTGKAII